MELRWDGRTERKKIRSSSSGVDKSILFRGHVMPYLDCPSCSGPCGGRQREEG